LLGGCAITKPPKPIETINFYAGEDGKTAATEPAVAENSPPVNPSATAPAVPNVARAVPSTMSAVSLGQFMSLGAVVAEVNGTPIYANRIVRTVRSALIARARELDERRFRLVATDLIDREIVAAIRDEVVFATAQRTLDEKEKDIADLLTTQWRNRQISEFGGSPELARRSAVEIAHKNELHDDLTFDELVMAQYRYFLRQVFAQKKIIPRIQVTPTDMHDYYNRHLQSEFTELSQVRFRLIQIDPAKRGGKDAAIDKATVLLTRVTAGHEDFAKVASEENDYARIRATGGDMGWVQSGALVLTQVEAAVWKTQPGEVTDKIIEDRGGYYIAKVEDRKTGRVREFASKDVQEEIYKKLSSAQYRVLMDRAEESLAKSAVVRGWRRDASGQFHADPDMMAPALDMAMQMYPLWSATGTISSDAR
jgi:parvulin-like peptidyl-prolyl isomerase